MHWSDNAGAKNDYICAQALSGNIKSLKHDYFILKFEWLLIVLKYVKPILGKGENGFSKVLF